MVDREQLGQLSKWAGIVGILTIIFGALYAIAGLFAFVVGAIPGVVMVIMGVKLMNAKKSADEILMSGDEDGGKITMLISNLGIFLKIQGIFYIISIVLVILMFIFSAIFGIAMMGHGFM
ncbi:MAG: DUF5362 family protein [Bacillota bacterium]